MLVIDGPAFDAIAGVPPEDRNREGLILGPHEFTEAAVEQIVSDPTALPAGAGALLLALRHRASLGV